MINRETLVSSGVHIGAVRRLGSSYSILDRFTCRAQNGCPEELI